MRNKHWLLKPPGLWVFIVASPGWDGWEVCSGQGLGGGCSLHETARPHGALPVFTLTSHCSRQLLVTTRHQPDLHVPAVYQSPSLAPPPPPFHSCLDPPPILDRPLQSCTRIQPQHLSPRWAWARHTSSLGPTWLRLLCTPASHISTHLLSVESPWKWHCSFSCDPCGLLAGPEVCKQDQR